MSEVQSIVDGRGTRNGSAENDHGETYKDNEHS